VSINIDELEREAKEWDDEDADWYPGCGPKVQLALIARIRELEAALAQAIAMYADEMGAVSSAAPGNMEDLDHLRAVLAKGVE
jgi:hypothetical protein